MRTMRKHSAILLIFVAFLPGCRHARTADQSDNAPRLKSMLKRSDVLLIKRFYASVNIDGDQDPKFDSILPGRLQIAPLWIYEPKKESEGLKGVTVTVIPSRISGEEGAERNEDAILDIDELRDLDSALGALRSPNASWRSAQDADHTEEEFSAKDDFGAAAFHDASDGRDILYIHARTASLVLNFSKADEMQRAVHDAITLLESRP